MTHGAQCTCYDCLTVGPRSCAKTPRCWLRHGHPGDCASGMRFARMFLRELRRRVGTKIAGRA